MVYSAFPQHGVVDAKPNPNPNPYSVVFGTLKQFSALKSLTALSKAILF
uniref:Uncharacterized protein n=1 Tax=Siphoviridae sp. ct4Am4 TaxID=2826287 RepID=A0A8S5R2D9_9CAUD|nr:MAG TPA: hypothetical protein [Siphoviridae sp. ct4Am4]